MDNWEEENPDRPEPDLFVDYIGDGEYGAWESMNDVPNNPVFSTQSMVEMKNWIDTNFTGKTICTSNYIPLLWELEYNYPKQESK